MTFGQWCLTIVIVFVIAVVINEWRTWRKIGKRIPGNAAMNDRDINLARMYQASNSMRSDGPGGANGFTGGL